MSRPLRVLYVEDDAIDADLTSSWLEANAPDLALDVVRTGKECLERLDEDSRYDVLLLDNHLPDMDGVELLKALAGRAVQLPAVMTTSVGDEALVVQVLRLGASDYIPKSGDYVERLPGVLRSAVSGFRDLRQQRRVLGGVTRRVLYAEHNPADSDLTGRHLAEVAPHLQLELASSAESALERAATGVVVDLVLVDLRMPDMSALELLREARYRGIAVPVVVITGRGDETAATAAVKLGAYDYIVKRNGYLDQLPYAIENAIARFELEQANRRLEAELEERRRAEDVMRGHAAALADAARQKDEFLAMLGHELRNPLAPIRTALELVSRVGHQDTLTVNAYDVMTRQIAHMVRLLDDLLDVARITSGRITLEAQTVDLRSVVADAIESVQELVQARHHTLETSITSEPLLLRGDATRLVQVLVNLLNNAAKYTNEGGTIRVVVTSAEGQAELRVSDTGTGISPGLLPRIFDLFAQDERPLDRSEGGLGLGLTLVRRITELHGGTVRAMSQGRGKGSEFVVTLPLLSAAEHLREEARTPEFRREHLRCLVVEDNVDAAHMLDCALSLEGHEVRLAYDGRDALAAAVAFKPDAVVLDIGLPRMNGYETARALRELPGLADVLIVALTGYGQDEDFEKTRAAGFDAHLVKPVEIDALLRALAAGASAL